MMRFEIERTCISAHQGHGRDEDEHSTTVLEAATLEKAISEFVRTDKSQLIGEVLKFESESLATVRKNDLLYLLRLHTSEVA